MPDFNPNLSSRQFRSPANPSMMQDSLDHPLVNKSDTNSTFGRKTAWTPGREPLSYSARTKGSTLSFNDPEPIQTPAPIGSNKNTQ